MILYWLDVETTGLDPQYNHLLEVAIVATRFEPGLPAIGSPAHAVFRYPEALRMDSIHPDVLAMHASNGLWSESREAPNTYTQWNVIANQMAEWPIAADEEGMLAGRSVHFDLAWIKSAAPWEILDAMKLSHRIFDLTAIKRFTELCGWEDVYDREYVSEHRALPDVLDDINLARNTIGVFSVKNWARS